MMMADDLLTYGLDSETRVQAQMLCRKPGLAGLRFCGNLPSHMPRHIWRELLPVVHRARPNPAGWQLCLATAWTLSSSTVVASVQGDERLLRAYFEMANFSRLRLPYLRRVINEQPRERVYYRGGQGSADELARGYSWTAHLDEAAHYAHDRPVRPGPPVIIRRHVRADEVALQLRGPAGGETVVLDHGYDSIVEISPAERKRLAKRWLQRADRCQRWGADVLSVPEDVLLEGWTP